MAAYRTTEPDLDKARTQLREAFFSLMCAATALRRMYSVNSNHPDREHKWQSALGLAKTAVAEIDLACEELGLDPAQVPHRETLARGPLMRRLAIPLLDSSSLLFKLKMWRTRNWICDVLNARVPGGAAGALAGLPDPEL